MILAIVLLVFGIIGFVKGWVNVSAKRELHGKWMRVVCTIFCLPLPLALIAGIINGGLAGGKPSDLRVAILDAAAVWLPLLVGVAVALIFAQPKVRNLQSQSRGFEVQLEPPR